MRYRHFILVLTLVVATLPAFAQDQPPRPYVDPALLQRVDKVAGFDSGLVLRHYYLLKNGGAIEVTAKDKADEATIKAIQKHLQKESDLYTKGNFENLAQIYGRSPDFTAILKKLRDEVTFAMVPEENGAILRMLTVNQQAKSAIHDYLKFQIDQLKTGDPTTVPAE